MKGARAPSLQYYWPTIPKVGVRDTVTVRFSVTVNRSTASMIRFSDHQNRGPQSITSF